jgi:hypothetical protein
MSAITIENSNIKIPVEMVEGDGLAILTLAQNAYLVVRAETLSRYPTELLRQLQEKVQSLQPATPSPAYHLYSPQKARAMRELRAQGYNVYGGEEYGLKPSTIPLEQVQQELASIQGSLADDVIAERDER